MKAFVVLLLAGVTTLFSAGVLVAEEGPVVIRNKYLEVRTDRETGEITVLARGKPIVTSGRIVAAGRSPKVLPLADDRLGVDSFSVESSDGRFRASVSFCGDGRFLLIHPGLYNNAADLKSLTKLAVFRGAVAISDKGHSVRLLGTGGLVKSGKITGSYMWLAVAQPDNPGGVVAGFVSSDRGSGVVFADTTDNPLQIDAQIEYGRLLLKPEERCGAENFVIGYFDDVRDGMEAWADEVVRTYKIELRPQPSGYCTWYHAAASNEEAMVRQTEIAARELKPYGFDFLQIDDGWQDGIKKNGPRKNFTRSAPTGRTLRV